MEPRRQLKPRLKHPELPYGVYWRNRTKPYVAKVYRKRLGTKYLGSFTTIAEASAAVRSFTLEPTA